MAKNDKVLIDGIVDERITLKIPSEKRDEVFEYFAFEQILKDYDLSVDEIKNGTVDGQDDGGIDGFYILVNGHYLSDLENFKWPKSGAILELWIITCKHHDTFKQAPLDNLVASMVELLDFTIEGTNLNGDYNEKVIRFRENLRYAYRKVSPRLTNFYINFAYASRGNTLELGNSVVSRSQHICHVANDAFGNCKTKFTFLGSTQLVELQRKVPNFSLELPFIESLSSNQKYILLVNLREYFNFIQDTGKLRRYLFDSNVRDFMGLNRVNEDIRDTLSNMHSPDFWWLNNGVTILATGAVIIGKSIKIEDIQIVNGLQTSESIFRHFESGGVDINNRSVLVKVLVSNDERVRDTIIRATNNQTAVELASLHATDKIQRDIEDVLKLNDWYYERRTNFYKNQGISQDKIVSPLYLASGYVSMILKAADQASRLKSRFMRSEESYGKVFSESADLNVWPQIASILKSTDSFLESVRPSQQFKNEQFLKGNRQYLSFLTVSRLLGKFTYSVRDLINLDISKYTMTELQTTWNLIQSLHIDENVKPKTLKKNLFGVCSLGAIEWNIKGIERIIGEKKLDLKDTRLRNFKESKLSMEEFAMKVNEILPEQPWKPRIHLHVMEILKCTQAEYFDAVKFLIHEGLRYRQKDGVVYDTDGNVISFDNERVDSETLLLKPYDSENPN